MICFIDGVYRSIDIDVVEYLSDFKFSIKSLGNCCFLIVCLWILWL